MKFRQFVEQTKIVLWVDDIRPMPTNFNQHATTEVQAIEILKTGNVVEISLDHDLGPQEAGSGYGIAKFIEEQAYYNTLRPLKWAIHSANIVGQKNIRMALENADKFWRNHE